MPRRFFYAGRRLYKGKNFHFFAKEDAPDDVVTYFPKAKAAAFAGAQIGHLYEFPDDGIPARWESLGKRDDDVRLTWQLEDQGATSKANEMKLSNSPDLDKIVNRLRYARSKLPPSQRAAFDAWLLSNVR